MSWGIVAGAVIGAAGSYLSARESNKAADAASKPRTETRTSVPYMNDYISKLVPYILSEQQRVYESRMKQYGMSPGDYAPITQMLAGISSGYTGVGGFGGDTSRSPFPGSFDGSRFRASKPDGEGYGTYTGGAARYGVHEGPEYTPPKPVDHSARLLANQPQRNPAVMAGGDDWLMSLLDPREAGSSLEGMR